MIEKLLRVQAALRGNSTDMKVVRVGSLLGKPFLDLAKEPGLGQHLHQTGKFPDEEVELAYGVSGALLCPSLKEGFGWPVVEAMASGLPVAGSNGKAIASFGLVSS